MDRKGSETRVSVEPGYVQFVNGGFGGGNEEGKMGGVRLGEEKIWTLAYADDVVLISEEDGMRSMIERLEGYLERKGLELNVGKSKIMRFRKGGGRERVVNWRWKGKVIEEVKEFTYLGYTVQRNGGQEAHIRERLKKGAAVMRQVWGIGKRKFKKEWGKRIWLFDKLVWTVMGYGVEIWGWKERGELERLQERYLRWVLGVDWGTPGYMIREELQRDKLRGRAGKRAWGFERRLEEGKGSEIARRCWDEMRGWCKRGKGVSKWEEERCGFFGDRGISMEEMEGQREEGMFDFGRVITREIEIDREERWERIENSSYNVHYKGIKGRGIPGYLKKGWGESRWQRVAKFRLGNGMRGNSYWKSEEEKRCRMCGGERETWEHVWERCVDWGVKEGWQVMAGKILGESGEGEGWLRELERVRNMGRGEQEEEGEGNEGRGLWGIWGLKEECERERKGVEGERGMNEGRE